MFLRKQILPWLPLLLGTLAASAAERPEARDPEFPGPRASTERSGVIQTAPGQSLQLSIDMGAVRIFTLEPGVAPVVRYTVHIETDARAPLASRLLSQYSLSAMSVPGGVQITGSVPGPGAHARVEGQFWVRLDVTIPRSYSVDVSTGAGDIETGDIGGAAILVTQGGNIRSGNIAAVARLSTDGGHINIGDVAGNLVVNTGGGHIDVGNVAGDASLHSGGGHIHSGHIAGRSDFDTAGGNVTVRQADSTVTVHTGGGQIDFGEVRGSVRAQTGGGGIRILYVAGPMEVETSAGSICLTRVAGSVRAQTAGGTITAWISPDAASPGDVVRLAGASQLASGAGDIVVFLPRNLAATIDAIVEHGGENHIQADVPLNIQLAGARGGAVRATGALNGGGALLKLKTAVGKIRLQYIDADLSLRQSLMREQMERVNQAEPVLQRVTDATSRASASPQNTGDWFDSWWSAIEEKLRGGVSEDAEELQKRLIYSPPPIYPPLAEKAGIQGTVRLQVRVGKDGNVEVVRILEGEPALANAAIAAVKQWRYSPKWVNKKKISVISDVAFNFLLR